MKLIYNATSTIPQCAINFIRWFLSEDEKKEILLCLYTTRNVTILVDTQKRELTHTIHIGPAPIDTKARSKSQIVIPPIM